MYSVGATGVIDALGILRRDYRAPVWDVVLVNIQTLIRNNLSKENTNEEIVKGIFEDMDNIVYAVRDYLQSRPKPPIDPKILIYLPTYAALHPVYQRPENATTARIKEIQDMLIVKYITNPDEPEVVRLEGIECITMKAGSLKEFPHQTIFKYLDESRKPGKSKFLSTLLGWDSLRIGMISHCAIDWHLAFKVRHFHLIESYTGKIKEISQFGEKVFKTGFVPFCRATHLLFGDSTHVKPLAQRKNKQILLDLAKNSRWYSKTESSIINEAVGTGLLPRESLTVVKF